MSDKEVKLVHSQPADSAEHTVAHQEVSPWDQSFYFGSAGIKCTALTRFDNTALTMDGAYKSENEVIFNDNIAAVTVKGDNLAASELKQSKYICIELKTDNAIRLTLWGSDASGSAFSLSGTGSSVLGAHDEQVTSFTVINEEDSGYVSIPEAFNGTVIIPTDRIDGWRGDAISSLTLKVKGGASASAILTCSTPLTLNNQSKNAEYRYTAEDRLTPYWVGNTAYNEAMAMHLGDDGVISGTLLYVPERIISVLDVYLKKEYKEGVDWIWEAGTNRIVRTPDSSIPYFTEDFLSGRDENGELIPSFPEWTDGVSRFGECIYCVSPKLYEKQLAVSYTYDPAQRDALNVLHAPNKSHLLPLTTKRLEKGEDLNVLFYGDSIFSGCDASSMYNREPFMPYMHQLIQQGLQKRTSGKVRVNNIAVGGWSVQNGYDALFGPLKGADGNPIAGSDKSSSFQGYDLLIMSYGMNDMNVENPQKVFTDYTTGIIDTIRKANPNMEVVLVSCMNPNPRVHWNVNQHRHADWFEQIAARRPYNGFTAVVDFYSVHSSLLKRKSFASTTGNNINHPNDWLIRAYAQNILAAILK